MTEPVTVLVYSDNSATREHVLNALGERPDRDLPALKYLEVATFAMVLQLMDHGGVDLAILDGEATPVGGFGIAKQLKDELEDCPPLIVLMGRAVDSWLARWSRADAALRHPVEHAALTRAAADLLRGRKAPNPIAPDGCADLLSENMLRAQFS